MTDAQARLSTLLAVFQDMRPALERRARGLGAGADAEDVLQDMWLKVQGSPVEVSNPQGYLMRMVYTTVLDRKRGLRRSNLRDEAWTRHALPDAHIKGAEQALIVREALLRVEAKLQEIGDPAALIFRRHRIDGLSQRQVAAELGLGLSTVEKHLRRVYASLLDMENEA